MAKRYCDWIFRVLVFACLVALGACDAVAAPFAQPTPADDTTGASEEETPATPTRLPPGAVPIHILGRSVTYGWFEHWGWQGDDETPVVRGRYVLFHHSIDTPDNMVNSVREIVTQLPNEPNLVVQWKFCFEDFGGADEAQPTLQRNQQIVQQVYQAIVTERHYRLIIGNALPPVAPSVDSQLTAAQRQYNQWLNDFANARSQRSSRDGQVFVFDQYAPLADKNGALRAAFASASDDSHPNAAGYRALDAQYFSFLDRVLR